MSMPETLTIYKVQFGDGGHLLSFISPQSGYVEAEEYISMKRYDELHSLFTKAVNEVITLRDIKEY